MISRKYFTIIEENGVTETLAEAIKTDPRVDDIFEALKWRLARDPEVGVLVQHEGIDYRLIYFRPVKGARNPYVLAKYTFQDDQIVIDWVKVYPYDEDIAYTTPSFDITQ